MRCGTFGTSGHVTAKSSIRSGVCFINPASTRGTFCVLPWEISRLSTEVDWEPGDRRRPAGRSQQRAK